MESCDDDASFSGIWALDDDVLERPRRPRDLDGVGPGVSVAADGADDIEGADKEPIFD